MPKRLRDRWLLEESKIKYLIANGELDKAADYLVSVTKKSRSPRHNDAIIIAGEVKYITRMESVGVVKFKALLRERTRLSRSILMMLDDIKSSIMSGTSNLNDDHLPLQSFA